MKFASLTKIAAVAAAVAALSTPAFAEGSSCSAGASYSKAAKGGGEGAEKKDAKNIVEIASANEDFSTLVAAVKAAGLVDALSGDGPFTVFAPTNDAFKKLPEGTVDNLLKPENKEKLQAVLKYHVVKGAVKAADVVKLTEAETLQGGKVTIKVDGDKVKVDGANVVKTDIEAKNGVIHVIDAVILPKE